MCWEHEELYHDICFDFLWNDHGILDDTCIVKLLEEMGIEFKDHKTEQKCRTEFFELLSKWHDNGYIKPEGT